MQHRRKGGDLPAGLIDLLCCRSVFSLLAGSDPETPHTHARTLAKHTIKTYANIQINKYDLSLMPIPYWVEQTCKYRWRRKTCRNNSAISQSGVFDADVNSVTHNLRQDVKLNKHMLYFFDKKEKWIRDAKFYCNWQQLSQCLSLFYHPSGTIQGSNTAKIQMEQRQHQAGQIFHFLGKSMVGQKFQVLCLEMCLRITHSE